MSKIRSFFKEVPKVPLILNISTVFFVQAFLYMTGIVHYSLRGLIIVIGVLFACLILAIGISFCLYCYFSKKGGAG